MRDVSWFQLKGSVCYEDIMRKNIVRLDCQSFFEDMKFKMYFENEQFRRGGSRGGVRIGYFR